MRFILAYIFLFSQVSFASHPTSELASDQTRASQTRGMHFSSGQFNNIILDFALIAGIYAIGRKLPKDKRGHLYAGAITGRVASIWCGKSNPHPVHTKNQKRKFLCSLGAATAAGVVKEIYDSTGRGNVEFADALVTAAGGAIMGIRYLF